MKLVGRLLFIIFLTSINDLKCQSLNSVLFKSEQFAAEVEALVDSAKVTLLNLNGQIADENRPRLDTSLYTFLPVINATVSTNHYRVESSRALSEVLLIDKKSGRISGAIHFTLTGAFGCLVKDRYLPCGLYPWDQHSLHYIPLSCYKSLSNILKRENQEFRLISVRETRSSYLLRKQHYPVFDNEEQHPIPICK